MASIFLKGWPPVYFRVSQVKNPSDKIMMVDEATPEEHQKFGALTVYNGSAWGWSHRGVAHQIPSGQEVPSLFSGDDWVTLRHSGKGTVVHTDGHVEVVRTNYWVDLRHCDPTFAE